MVVTRKKNNIKRPREYGEAEKAIDMRGCGCLHGCEDAIVDATRASGASVGIGMAPVAPLT
jgi:hypothetical protein